MVAWIEEYGKTVLAVLTLPVVLQYIVVDVLAVQIGSVISAYISALY